MILVFLIWVVIFALFLILGFSLAKVINKISNQKDEYNSLSFDEYFFIGFLTLSSVAGLLSIFIPIGSGVLLFTGLITILLFLINSREILIELKKAIMAVSNYNKLELVLLSFLVFFILTAVVQNITWLDTQSYHAQNIQWIRKYAVVPGLGNLHDRFCLLYTSPSPRD